MSKVFLTLLRPQTVQRGQLDCETETVGVDKGSSNVLFLTVQPNI